MSSNASASATLIDLPDELLLSVIKHLNVQDVLRLACTCKLALTISRSDEVWRHRVEQVVNAHIRRRSDLTTNLWEAGNRIYASYVQPTLGYSSRYLGWWASTQPYRGRLTRVSLRLLNDGGLGLIGEEVAAANAYSPEYVDRIFPPPRRWKPAAALWSGSRRLSYRLPVDHPSPDAGYSVDILKPALQFTPLFNFAPGQGFALFSSITGVVAPSIPISLPLDYSRRRKLRDISGSSAASRNPPFSSDVEASSFPGKDAVYAGIIRNVDCWGSTGHDVNSSMRGLKLEGRELTAAAFTMQPIRAPKTASSGSASAFPFTRDALNRSASSVSTSDTGVQFIHQAPQNGNLPQADEPALLLAPNPATQFIQSILTGIGVNIPTSIRETLLGETGVPNDDDQEWFYPIMGPTHSPRERSTPADEPYPASALRGLWTGTYSTHGQEFGIISVRSVWAKPNMVNQVDLDRIYDGEGPDDSPDADPSIAREALQPDLEGNLRRRTNIIEFIKVTGDTNVPSGQVSWVAELPSTQLASCNDPRLSAMEEWLAEKDASADMASLELPVVMRSDWENWSDLVANPGSQMTSNSPRWYEGTLRAAGRIAMPGFMDTRFIRAEAIFVREDTGEVDEIRVRCFLLQALSSGLNFALSLASDALAYWTNRLMHHSPLSHYHIRAMRCHFAPEYFSRYLLAALHVTYTAGAAGALPVGSTQDAVKRDIHIEMHAQLSGSDVSSPAGMRPPFPPTPPEMDFSTNIEGMLDGSTFEMPSIQPFSNESFPTVSNLSSMEPDPDLLAAVEIIQGAPVIVDNIDAPAETSRRPFVVTCQKQLPLTVTRTKTVTYHRTAGFSSLARPKPSSQPPKLLTTHVTTMTSHQSRTPAILHTQSASSSPSSVKVPATAAMSKVATPVQSSAPSIPLTGFAQQAIDAHNSWRAFYGVGKVRWNDTLAEHALDWARQCKWEHDPRLQGWLEGQNLDTEGASDGSAQITGDSMLNVWVKGKPSLGILERTEYDPDQPEASHFTQVVWKDSTQVGCAIVECPAAFASVYPASWPNAKYAVCNYFQGGNIPGQYAENVLATDGGRPLR